MMWDTAAGQCIAESAGAQVLTVDGEPLHYQRENLLNPFFVVSLPR
ncbi:3'(2'),5'-bisphosphate nucleotidase [Photobacterium aphoticum]|nr:3'(2'),5'-bisphosphate nucleotidase [Photobacterium aphoticum]